MSVSSIPDTYCLCFWYTYCFACSKQVPHLKLKTVNVAGRVLHAADGQQQLVPVPAAAPDSVRPPDQDVQPGRQDCQRGDEGQER